MALKFKIRYVIQYTAEIVFNSFRSICNEQANLLSKEIRLGDCLTKISASQDLWFLHVANISRYTFFSCSWNMQFLSNYRYKISYLLDI